MGQGCETKSTSRNAIIIDSKLLALTQTVHQLTSPQYSLRNSFLCTLSLRKIPQPATSEGASNKCLLRPRWMDTFLQLQPLQPADPTVRPSPGEMGTIVTKGLSYIQCAQYNFTKVMAVQNAPYSMLSCLHSESTRISSVTRALMVQIQRFYDFLKAQKELFQMVCSNCKFETDPKFFIFHGIQAENILLI